MFEPAGDCKEQWENYLSNLISEICYVLHNTTAIISSMSYLLSNDINAISTPSWNFYFLDVMFDKPYDDHFRAVKGWDDEPRGYPIDEIELFLDRRDRLSFFCAMNFLIPNNWYGWFEENYLSRFAYSVRVKYNSIGFKKKMFDSVMKIKGIDQLVISFLDQNGKNQFSNALIKNPNFACHLKNVFNVPDYFLKSFEYCFERTRKVTKKDKIGKNHQLTTKEITENEIKILIEQTWGCGWKSSSDTYHPALSDKGVQEMIHTFCHNNMLLTEFTIAFVQNNNINFVYSISGENYNLDIQPITYFLERCAKRRKIELQKINRNFGYNGWGKLKNNGQFWFRWNNR